MVVLELHLGRFSLGIAGEQERHRTTEIATQDQDTRSIGRHHCLEHALFNVVEDLGVVQRSGHNVLFVVHFQKPHLLAVIVPFVVRLAHDPHHHVWSCPTALDT